MEPGQLSMDKIKVKGLLDWPTPTTIKEVQSFLGFGNFYQKFIKKFTDLVQPLNNLLKKDTKFLWTDECQKSFDILKKWFTKEPVLMMPDTTKPFEIKTDASKYATGAVLTQTDINGDRHPVAFYSKSLSEAEQNYEIYIHTWEDEHTAQMLKTMAVGNSVASLMAWLEVGNGTSKWQKSEIQ